MGLSIMQVQLSIAKAFITWAYLAMCITSSVDGLGQNQLPQSPAPGGAPNVTEEFLGGHNQARAAVGVKPQHWSLKLASLASRLVRYQRDKRSCDFASTDLGFGSNQEKANYPRSPSEVVESWVAEKKYYNYADNSCAPNHTCGVYTQVVWNTSLELGCAQASCAKGGASITICLYNPPGNYVGQRPY
ncbi:hypothetical protein MRB53_007457 [Persea americana]|uniref:Uncharacterized protein n=1 Tax=Persea americana TaxID=3435 RepID=A0ACC2MJ88_PERAE|nr:hypothetical protein MRB53_007457 [Persea americana]